MMRLALSVVLLALSVLPAGVRAQALSLEPIDSIVAVVEEDVILRSELDRAVQNILNSYRGREEMLPPRDVLEKQMLDRLILTKLQLQRAEASGIRVSDTDLDRAVQQLAQQNNVSVEQLRQQLARDGIGYEEFRDSLREELVIQRMRQRVVQSRVAVSDTEIDILLASNSLKQGEVNVAHVLVALPEDADAEQIELAKTKIDGIRKLIDEGMAFSAAAIRYSDAPNALEGGGLGWRGYDEVPTLFANALQSMDVGEVSQPIRGPSGYHLVQLVDRRNQDEQTVTEYNARGIMIRTTELVSSEQARERIEAIRARIAAGEDFAEVAKEVSDDTLTRNQGGDMGWFEAYAYGTAVGDMLTSLEDGELSEPFRSNAGWHIVERLGTREQNVTQERLREQARETIARRKSDEELERFMRQLRDEAFIDNRLG